MTPCNLKPWITEWVQNLPRLGLFLNSFWWYKLTGLTVFLFVFWSHHNTKLLLLLCSEYIVLSMLYFFKSNWALLYPCWFYLSNSQGQKKVLRMGV